MSSVSGFTTPELTRPFSVRASGVSVRGIGREQNEDCFAVDSSGRFFVVTDGISGSPGGQVASRIACDVLDEELGQLSCNAESFADSDSGCVANQNEQICIELLAAMRAANDAITSGRQFSWRNCEMGTTAIAAVIVDEYLCLASIGDSRACLIRDGVIQRLTSDHTMTAGLVDAGLLSTEEAVTHQYRNVLYKYLGAWSEDDPADVESVRIQSGDCLVLATDGLTDYVTEEEISAACEHIGDSRQVARELVDHALKNGSSDDITCVVAHVL